MIHQNTLHSRVAELILDPNRFSLASYASITMQDFDDLDPEFKKIFFSIVGKIQTTGPCMSFVDEVNILIFKKDLLKDIDNYIDSEKGDINKRVVLKFYKCITSAISTSFLIENPIEFSTDEIDILNKKDLYKYIKLIESINSKVELSNKIEDCTKVTSKKSLCIFSRLFNDFTSAALMNQINGIGPKIQFNINNFDRFKKCSFNRAFDFLECMNSQEVQLADFDFSKYHSIFFIGHGNENGFRYETAYSEKRELQIRLKDRFLINNIEKEKSVFLFSCSNDFYEKIHGNFQYSGVSKDGFREIEYFEMFLFGYQSVLAITDDEELAISAGLMCSQFRDFKKITIKATRKVQNQTKGYEDITL